MHKQPRLFFLGLLSLSAVFLAACNAALPAGAEAKISPDGKSAQVEFTGVIDSVAADHWVIAGQTVLISAQTTVDGVFAAGDSARVQALVTTDGRVTADKIERPFNSSGGEDPTPTPGSDLTATAAASGHENVMTGSVFTGKVDAIAADSWSVGGQIFAVNDQTVIKGNIAVGDLVRVHYVTNADGSFSATEIQPAGDEQNPEEDNPTRFEVTGKVEAFAPDAWTVNGQVFAINAQTQIKGTILQGDVVKVHYVVNPDGTFMATEIALAGNNEAHNSDKKLTGVLEELTSTQATISGVVVLITSQTQLDNGLVVGGIVKADVVTNPDGTITALTIRTSNNSGDHNGRGGDGSGGFNHGPGQGDGQGSGFQMTPQPGHGDGGGGD